MKKIFTLNKISPVGLNRLTSDYAVTDNVSEASGILVRSQDMLEMEFSPELKCIARAGAGVNNIPLDRCAQEGIVVFNTPGANANAVKELVLCGMLMAMRNVPMGMSWANSLAPNDEMDVAKQVEKGKSKFAGHEVSGKTIAILGLGAIGRKLSASCQSLGMKVLGYDPFVKECEGVEIYTELKEMLPIADIISLHLPANEKTKKMINKEVIASMKDGVVLLNFSRDKLVNESDILEAIQIKKISKYVCDFPTDNMVGKENVILIPHLGASSEEAEDNCAKMAVDETMNFLENGNIINSVNFPKLDMGSKGDSTRIALITRGLENPMVTVMEELAALNINVTKCMVSGRADGISYVLADIGKSPIRQFAFDNQDHIIGFRFMA